MRWHARAVLVTADSKRTTAREATKIPPEVLLPTRANRALPLFFRAIARGEAPMIGGASLMDRPRQFCTQTGGTTGAPKRLLRHCSSWEYSINQNRFDFDITPASSVAVLGDLTHSLALYAGAEALSLGAEFHILAGIRQLPQALIARGITHLYATPTQLRILRGNPNPQMRYCIIGGGALPLSTATHIQSLFPNAEVIRFYGASETSFITTADQTQPVSSIGSAYPGVELEIRGVDGTKAPVGSVGAIWVRSPMTAAGLVTPQGIEPVANADGWVSVGELGALDANQCLTITGRVDRMVRVAEHSIHLDQIEAAAMAAGVQHAGAISLPDEIRGNRILLIASNTPDSLREALAATLPKHAQPRRIVKLADWPLLQSGKTDYAALMSLFDHSN